MLKKFLTDKRGESLIETLAAILIFTMASIGLYSMIMSANNSNNETMEKDKAIQEQIIVAEAGNGTAKNGTVTMTIQYESGGRAPAGAAFQTGVDVYCKPNGEGIIPVDGSGNISSAYSFFRKP